jgi:hypothetical protein
MANVALEDLIAGGVVSAPVSVTDGTTTVSPATSLRLPAGTLSDLTGGEAGVGLILSRIGPFHFTYSDMGIAETGGSPQAWADGGYLALASLPDGCIVLMSWVEPIVSFVDGTATSVGVGLNVQPTNDPDNSSTVSEWDGRYWNNGGSYALATILTPVGPIARVVSGAQLMTTRVGAVAAVAGEANVYVIVATPAA